MTIKTVIRDLLFCLENNPAKREKRTTRVLFICRIFDYLLDEEIRKEVEDVLNKVMDDMPVPRVEVARPVRNFASRLDRLRQETQRPRAPGMDVLLPKQDPATYTLPEARAFHDKCKDRLNKDGSVYDVFTRIARIAYSDLLNSENQSVLRLLLLSKSKLVLKGGAAVGKFLFQRDNRVWNSMSETDKQFVRDNFINGGDNDTSLMFDPSVLELGWDKEVVNSEIASIILDLQHQVLRVVRSLRTHVSIQSYLSGVTQEPIEFEGEVFDISEREAVSFMIVDRDANNNELMFVDEERGPLFGSLSYLEFPNVKGEMIKFYLARVKAAYSAASRTSDLRFNCYAECLDISAPCIDSAVPHVIEYQDVSF